MIKFFSSETCSRCQIAKEEIKKIKNAGYEITEYSVTDMYGLAEFAIHDGRSIPMLVITLDDEDETEIKKWTVKINAEEIIGFIKNEK